MREQDIKNLTRMQQDAALLNMDDKEICFLAAELLNGWRIDDENNCFMFMQTSPVMSFDDWQPTFPSDVGKAQCFDLLLRYEISIRFREHKNDWFVSWKNQSRYVSSRRAQRAIVLACIYIELDKLQNTK